MPEGGCEGVKLCHLTWRECTMRRCVEDMVHASKLVTCKEGLRNIDIVSETFDCGRSIEHPRSSASGISRQCQCPGR